MASNDQIYTPQVIEESPFPGEEVATSVPGTSVAGTYSPRVIKESSFPTERIAVELLSSALNTRSKKILGEFQFTPSGALQIGTYTNGVSGDVRVSPNGIVARDSAGNTTFTLDGTTGSAVFAGTIQAGTVVAGQIAVGDDAIQIDGENKRMIWYADDGLPAIVIGEV
jgi:hypothetical protein